MKKSGFLVQTKDGKLGRTYHTKGMINDKVPVYLATEVKEYEGGLSVPSKFSETATLCDPKGLTRISFID